MRRQPDHSFAGRTRLLCSVLAAVLATGCAATASPDYDSRFGDAERTLRAQQTLDAGAPQRNAGVAPATDGRTVREAADRYLKSFKEPPQTSVINIGVGGGNGGGNGS